MSMAFILIKRNIKLFFKDKGMFFTSLITPAIPVLIWVRNPRITIIMPQRAET